MSGVGTNSRGVLLDCACHSGGAYRPACSIPGGCGSAGCACATPGIPGRSLVPSSADNEPCDRCNKPGNHTHCLSCGRRDPRPARICQSCRDRGASHLADLPDLMRRLELHLIPTQGDSGERVSSSSAHSAPAARIDALNLRTHSAILDADHPDWYTPANDLDPGDDRDGPMQFGTLSIPTWTRQWAREWRIRHDHHTSHANTAPTASEDEMAALRNQRPRPPQAPDRPPTDLPTAQAWITYRRDLLAWHTEMATWRAAVDTLLECGQRAILGIGDALPETERPDDPLADQWATRHGAAGEHHAVSRDAGYLGEWLESACDDPDLHPDVGDFMISLRRLHKAATVLVEGRAVDVYCGRCPEVRFDKASGQEEVCGTNLWSDPFTSVIICPRCKAETRRQDLLHLRARQLDRWTEAELSQPVSRAGVAA